jgi:hypothetical protein
LQARLFFQHNITLLGWRGLFFEGFFGVLAGVLSDALGGASNGDRGMGCMDRHLMWSAGCVESL